MKLFLSKTYKLLESTSTDIHPRQYIKSFKPLTSGSYNVFNEYPKFIVDYQTEHLQEIRQEEEKLLDEEEKLRNLMRKQGERIENERQSKLEAARLKKLEEAYHVTVRKEEDRLSNQRRKILDLKRDLRQRELQFLEDTKNKLMRKHTLERQKALERLIEDISRKRSREESDLQITEEEIKHHYMELMAHKAELEMELGLRPKGIVPSLEHTNLQREQENLRTELYKLQNSTKSHHHENRLKINRRVAVIEDLLQSAEMELAQECAAKQNHLLSAQDNMKLMRLESKTREIEGEVKQLLQQVSDVRISEADDVNYMINKSLGDRRKMNEEQHDILQAFRRGTDVDGPSETHWSPSVNNSAQFQYYLSNNESSMDHGRSRYADEEKTVRYTMDLRKQLIEDAKRFK